jgi:uncharacterized membrane protein
MSDAAFLAVLGLMAAIVFLTRIGGALALAWTPSTPRLERFLEGMAAAVIAALVATLLMRGGTVDLIAVAAASAVMAVSRSVIGSIIAGMATAIVCNQWTGL